MTYIWNNPDWPSYTYDAEEVERHYSTYVVQKKATDILFGIIDPDMRNRMHARSLTEEVLSSLEIEGETISYDSVYSSICKRLDIHLETRAKTDRYAEDISRIALDATGNLEEMSTARIKRWHSLLFSAMAGIKPRGIGCYRQGPVYIGKGNGKNPEIIYEGIPAQRVDAEMERLVVFINGENEKSPLVKSAIVSFRFLCIHPFEDGNGRISRAISDYVLSKGYHETQRVFSMSSLILTYRVDYYRLLQQISSQSESLDLTSWIVWNIDIAVQAKLEAIRVYQKSTRLTRFMKNLDPSVYNSRELSMLFKLADGSFDGKLSTDKWAKMNKCSPAAASRDIQHLLQEGFLIPSGDTGPKTGYFLDPTLLERV
ncbi:MAG: Fic family protein [Sphaerochaetaceae bacterium]